VSGFTPHEKSHQVTPKRIARRHLLSYLLAEHEAKGSLDLDELEAAARKFSLSLAEIYEVASFYPALGRSEGGARFDLSCWLSCSVEGDHPGGWVCRGQCAKSWSFETDSYGTYGRISAARVSADALIEGASASSRLTSIPRKWQRVLSNGKRPVLIVNADEGDPSTSKDRYLLETDPSGVLEGVLLAAGALNPLEIIFYINHQYDTALAALRGALLHHAEVCSGFCISIERSGGAYICGEETALVASLEGERAIPRERPYDLLVEGFLSHPTLVHNVESLYRLRALITPVQASPGHPLLEPTIEAISLSGRVARPGVKLLQWESSLRDLIASCGGLRDGHALGGVVVGGMLGTVVNGEMLEMPRKQLASHGVQLGHGAIIAFSDRDDLNAIVLLMSQFLAAESCGHCTPCRNGTVKAVAHLMSGGNVQQLADLGFLMKEASACGLGRSAGRFLERSISLLKEHT